MTSIGISHARAFLNHALTRLEFIAKGMQLCILGHPSNQYRWSRRPRVPARYWRVPTSWQDSPAEILVINPVNTVYGATSRVLKLTGDLADDNCLFAKIEMPAQSKSPIRKIGSQLLVPKSLLQGKNLDIRSNEFSQFLNFAARFASHAELTRFIKEPNNVASIVLSHGFSINHAPELTLNAADMLVKNWGKSDPSQSASEIPVSVICMTMRPQNIAFLCHQLKRQMGVRIELILGTHGFAITQTDRKMLANSVDSLTVLEIPANYSLGKGYNLLISRCTSNYIAKFDDDDCYGPLFLCNSAQTIEANDAAASGVKQALFKFDNDPTFYLRGSSICTQFTNSVLGASLCFRKDVFPTIQFADRSSGEDSLFLSELLANGYRLIAIPSSQFYVNRGSEMTHSWKVLKETITTHAISSHATMGDSTT